MTVPVRRMLLGAVWCQEKETSFLACSKQDLFSFFCMCIDTGEWDVALQGKQKIKKKKKRKNTHTKNPEKMAGLFCLACFTYFFLKVTIETKGVLVVLFYDLKTS